MLTFTNLTAGTIDGAELDGALELDDGWSLSFGGHSLEGRDQLGVPLADVPADRLFLGARFARPHWRCDLRWETRSAKRDPGSGEKTIPGVDLVTAGVDVELRPGMGIRLAVRNALDESYFNSADRKVPEAPGRSVSLSFRWSPSAGDESPGGS